MGICYLIANLDKRQYLSPSTFGDSGDLRSYLKGDHALALAMLTCDSRIVGIEPPAGSWAGGRVVAVMDCAPPGELGIATASDDEPDRNLYMLTWQEFEDISYAAIAMLCDWSPDYADRLARGAAEELGRDAEEVLRTWELWRLGSVLENAPSLSLRLALERHVGPGWLKMYQEIRRLHLDESDAG